MNFSFTPDEEQVNNLHNFQQHSRLHFIGQWKTKMKDYLEKCFEDNPSWNHGPLSHQLTFIHMDLDAFFCSIQLAKPANAHLCDKPVAIAAGHGNSDISSCNYVARRFGVRAGMYVNSAKQVCPELVTLGYDFPSCEHLLKLLYRIIFESFPSTHKMAMEVYSVDEVMIATDTEELESLVAFCEKVREELKKATKCTISCGIGPNILVSRLATAFAKPDGIYVVRRNEVPSFIAHIPFSEIHGAGDRTVEKVQELLLASGIRKRLSSTCFMAFSEAQKKRKTEEGPSGTDSVADSKKKKREEEETKEEDSFTVWCSDVQLLTKEDLQRTLGKKAGETFFRLCRGDDNRVVIRTGDMEAESTLRTRTVSSVACSMNYAVRPKSEEDVWKIVSQVLSDVCQKLIRHELAAGSLRLTVLERHPLHPKSTQKFMGRGKCIEVHMPIRFPYPLQGKDTEEMMEALQDTLRPLLVLTRKKEEAETDEEADARRASMLGVGADWEKGGTIWTVTLPSVPDMLIEDIRGLTIQATQLVSLRGDSSKLSGEKKRKQFRMSQHQQLTLSEAFSKTASNPVPITPSEDEEVQEISSVKTHEPSIQPPISSFPLGEKTRRNGSLSASGKKDDALHVKLGALMNMKLSDEFTKLWQSICGGACYQQDYFTVRACLRIAAFKVIEEALGTFMESGSSPEPQSSLLELRNAYRRLKPFEEFVSMRMPFDLDYS